MQRERQNISVPLVSCLLWRGIVRSSITLNTVAAAR
jgi:hypothetical protein